VGVTADGEVRLKGGKVGGAVRVGDTVRRPVGPWTPAVHALLEYLAPRIPHVPRVLGFDERGREVLTYLPGKVIDVDTESLTLAQIASVMEWTRAFHEAVAAFQHPGPWRYFPLQGTTMIGHNDIAPFNACFDGDNLAGVFDWDMAGPSTPLYELAFVAWTTVPLWGDIGAEAAAQRLTAIANGYGAFDARQILSAVPGRIRAMFDGMPAAAAAGDQGVANLITGGQERSYAKLAKLVARIPAIDRLLAG
jgi:aminoglycoside phosphotransferase (APT) family kinase protein